MRKARKIAGLILFLGMGFVMFIIISYVLRPRVNGTHRQYFTGFYEAEEESLNIVTLGSSAVYRYFNNPLLFEEYGLTSYNLATGGQPEQVLESLVDEVHKTQSPQLFIVETRQFVAKDKNKEKRKGKVKAAALNRVVDNMNYSWNRISLINQTVDGFSNRMEYYFDIIRYHDNWEMLDEEAWEYVDNKLATRLNGWRNVFTINEIELPTRNSITDREGLVASSEEALLSFLEKCKEEDIEVLFVATPWKITDDDMKQNNYMGDIIKENGFQFLDCNLLYEEIGLDPKKDFYDSRHTNVWGSQKFTRYLAEYIQANYEVKATHTDSVLERWNEIIQNNKESMSYGMTLQNGGTVE